MKPRRKKLWHLIDLNTVKASNNKINQTIFCHLEGSDGFFALKQARENVFLPLTDTFVCQHTMLQS
jgi:hypothetical protein